MPPRAGRAMANALPTVAVAGAEWLWMARGARASGLAQFIADSLGREEIELGDQPAPQRSLAAIFVAERAAQTGRVDDAVEVVVRIRLGIVAQVRPHGVVGDHRVSFELGIIGIEDERMPDFMVGDGIEIVLHITQVGGAPPVFILEGCVPAELVVVALDLGLESARAMNAQLLPRRLLQGAV